MRARKFLQTAVLTGVLGSVGCQPEPTAESTSVGRPTASEYTPQPNEVYLRRELPPSFADDTSTLTVDFPIRNETTAAVSFSGVRKSCGCSDAELGKTTLAPGEETTLGTVKSPDTAVTVESTTLADLITLTVKFDCTNSRGQQPCFHSVFAANGCDPTA